MKRKIIEINEEKCTGCGKCITGCPEGALQLIDGKARLVGELYCDGLGACIGDCPYDAISVVEREAEPYDEYKVMDNVVKGGSLVISAHLKHLKEHNQHQYVNQALEYLKQNNIEVPKEEQKAGNVPCGCPGTMQKTLKRENLPKNTHAGPVQSQLGNWPVQLTLLNPDAPYLQNADIVIAADCTAFAYANFHQKFLTGKVLIILCPKLDSTIDIYVDKLTHIFSTKDIKSVTIVHMVVPCCSGVETIVKKAMNNAGKNIFVKDFTVSLEGELI